MLNINKNCGCYWKTNSRFRFFNMHFLWFNQMQFQFVFAAVAFCFKTIEMVAQCRCCARNDCCSFTSSASFAPLFFLLSYFQLIDKNLRKIHLCFRCFMLLTVSIDAISVELEIKASNWKLFWLGISWDDEERWIFRINSKFQRMFSKNLLLFGRIGIFSVWFWKLYAS